MTVCIDTTAERLRRWQLEIVTAPMQGGGLCHLIQARHLDTSERWHHARSFPGTPEGHDAAVLAAFSIHSRMPEGWQPKPPLWFDMATVDPAAWDAWRESTLRR